MVVTDTGRWIIAVSITLLATAAVGPVCLGQELPTGEQVMDRYVEAMGGAEALGKITNLVQEGNFENQPQIKIEMYSAPPHDTYWRIASDKGAFEKGTYADVAWIMRADKIEILNGTSSEQELFDCYFHMPLKWRTMLKSVKTVELVDFQGEPCHKLAVTPQVGSDEVWHVSKATGLRLATTRTGPAGDLTLVSTDYRDVDGIKRPFKLIPMANGVPNAAMVFSSIRQNVELPKDRFVPPPRVKAMIDHAAAQNSKPPDEGEYEPEPEDETQTPEPQPPK